MDAKILIIIWGFLLIGTNGQALFNLGTLMISDQEPDASGNPVNQCTKTGCVGRLWIYYSDANRTRSWGTMEKNGINKTGRDIACRQLGYAASNFSDPRAPELDNQEVPIWLTDFVCNEFTHRDNLLQCNPTLCNEAMCNDHKIDLVISCDGELKYSDYDGEAYLIPPDEKPIGMQTTFGAIHIHMRGESRTITAANTSDVAMYFQSSRRDTLCKQMGFTGAATDTVYTIYALSGTYEFSNARRNSWFNIGDLKDCNGFVHSPSRCFGCCFNYPKGTGCDTSVCKPENTLVISCVYDTLNEHPDFQDKGSPELCQFKNEKLPDPHAACNFGRKGPSTATTVLAVFFSIVLLVLIIVVVFIIFYCCMQKNSFCKSCCKKSYNEL